MSNEIRTSSSNYQCLSVYCFKRRAGYAKTTGASQKAAACYAANQQKAVQFGANGSEESERGE
jgi:hypothetical protein